MERAELYAKQIKDNGALLYYCIGFKEGTKIQI